MVEQVGLSLFPHNSKFCWLFMEVRGGSLQGSQQGSPQSGCQSFQLSRKCLFTWREGHLSWQASPPGRSTKGTYEGGGVEKGL